MRTPPIVQPVEPGDVEAWARFVAVERARTYADIVQPGFLDARLEEVAGEAGEIREALALGTMRVAAAWHEGAIVGAAATAPNPMPWEASIGLAPAPADVALDALYVGPDWHGTGLADRLLALVLGDASTTLWLIAGNERARRFYARRGFAPWGEEASAGEGWNGIPMQRMLRPAAAPASA